MKAVTELIYRIKSMAFEANMVCLVDATPITFDHTGTMVMEDQPDTTASDELDQFAAASYKFDGTFPLSLSISGPNDTGGEEGGGATLRAIVPEYSVPWTGYGVDIWKDENGMFWLVGNLNWGFYDTDTGYQVGISTDGGSGGFSLPVEIDLILSSETYQVKGVAYASSLDFSSISSASLSFTATEWFPYATTTGPATPAWDTTTGLPINGGPGA